MHNEFTAIIERDDDWFIAYCPEIPGANGQGRTKEECLESLAEAIALILEDRRKVGLDSIDSCHDSFFLLRPLLTLAPARGWGSGLRAHHGDTLAIGLDDQDGAFVFRRWDVFLFVEGVHIGCILRNTRFQRQFGNGVMPCLRDQRSQSRADCSQYVRSKVAWLPINTQT